MGNIMVTVPLDDFVDGVKAITDLDTIRALVESGVTYCSDEVKVILGISIKKEVK